MWQYRKDITSLKMTAKVQEQHQTLVRRTMSVFSNQLCLVQKVLPLVVLT